MNSFDKKILIFSNQNFFNEADGSGILQKIQPEIAEGWDQGRRMLV